MRKGADPVIGETIYVVVVIAVLLLVIRMLQLAEPLIMTVSVVIVDNVGIVL